MALAGLNVNWVGSHDPAALADRGVTAARFPLRKEVDLADYVVRCGQYGILPILVLDRTSIEAFGPVDTLGNLAATAHNALQFYQRYSRYWVALQPGNEPDGTGEASWSMPQSWAATLGHLCRQYFPTETILTPGSVGGHADWWNGVDLSWADLMAAHPYGKRPTHGWPDPNWGTGFIADLLDDYAGLGLPLAITEVGLSTTEVTEALQAEYVGRMLDTLRTDPRVLLTTWFCADDATMVPEYGLWRTFPNDPKPAAANFTAAAKKFTAGPPLPSPGPGPTPPTPPTPVDPNAGLGADAGSLMDYWQSFRSDVVFNPNTAIVKKWLTDPYRYGPPVGPERSDTGQALVMQAFTNARLRWSPGMDLAEEV